MGEFALANVLGFPDISNQLAKLLNLESIAIQNTGELGSFFTLFSGNALKKCSPCRLYLNQNTVEVRPIFSRINMLGTVVDGRLLSTVSLDLRKQKPLLARPSGGRPDAVTVRSELEEMLVQINQEIQNLRNDAEIADAADTQAWQASAANLLTLINNLRDRNTGQVTVNAALSSLSQATGVITGVDSTAAASDPASWFAVFGTNLAQNGIYTYAGGVPARAPGFDTATALPAGFKIFDDRLNQQYVVADDAVAGAGGAISTVSIIPWTRVEEIVANSPLRKVGPVIELLFDRGIFSINAEGELDLSASFQQRIAAIEQATQTNATNIAAVAQRVTTAEGDIVELDNSVANNTTSINTHTTQIQALQTFDGQIGTRVQATETEIVSLDGRLDTAQSTLQTQGQTLTDQGNQITQVSTTVTSQGNAIQRLDLARQNLDGRLTTAEGAIADNAGDIASAVEVNDQQNARLGVLETEAATLVGLRQRVTTAEGEVDALQAAVVDAQSTIIVHGQQLTSLDTELDTKLAASELETRVDAMFAARNKIFTLRNDAGGPVAKTVTQVVSEGITFTSTSFRITTGFGSLNFRLVDVSSANSPYAKLPIVAKTQRTGVDAFEIEFWQPLNDDGTPNPVADGTYDVAVQRFYLGN